MTKEKIIEIAEKYREYFVLNGVEKAKFIRNDTSGDFEDDLAHCHIMLDKIVEFVLLGKVKKAGRWLGFVQGVLWSAGVYTLEDLQIHNSKIL